METRRSGAYGWLAGVTTHVVEGTVQLQQPVDQDGSYHAALRGKGAIGRKAKALTCIAYYGLVRRMPDLLRFRLAMYGPRTETKVGIRSYQLHWILDLTDHLQRLIAAEVHELELRDVTTGLLRPGDVAIDIGANVGAHALAWGREVGPAGRVFAFEPVPPNFQSLVKNVEGNGLQSVVIPIELALGSEDSALLLAHARGGSTSGGYSAFGEGPSYQVQQRRLDDVVTELNISGSVRLIKIDVEGSECRVLEEMARTAAAMSATRARTAMS